MLLQASASSAGNCALVHASHVARGSFAAELRAQRSDSKNQHGEIAAALELWVFIAVFSARVFRQGEDNMLMKSIAAGLAGSALFAAVAFGHMLPAFTIKDPDV